MENQHSVCFVGRVENILPIEGADKIEQAIISGWECVVRKGAYSSGDFVILATTDAVIPIELAESLGVTTYLKHRKKTSQYCVRTTKLRGVYSQALVLDSLKDGEEGADMMSSMGIFKYEEPVEERFDSNGKRIRYSRNPNFHIYYKFPNVKNVPEMFDNDDLVVVTEKIHGTNARYGIVRKSKITVWDRIKRLFGNKWTGYEFVYGSHNVEKGKGVSGYYPSDVWAKVGEKLDIEKKLWNFAKIQDSIGDGVIVYGEIYGPGIQKYYDYGQKELKFVLFDIKMDGEYVSTGKFIDICSQLQMDYTPDLYIGPYNRGIIDYHYKDRFLDKDKKIPMEGVVVKSIDGSRSKIAKFINPAYSEFQSKKEDSTDFH